jgi:archaemetzincin
MVPCGEVPPEILDFLKGGLEKEIAAEVTQIGQVPMPPCAYNPSRRQYRAEAFLPLLLPFRPGSNGLVLGVITVDLYVPDLNFVFGLADSRQKCAIISLARLEPEFCGQPSNPQLFRERALKEAVHELGHLLGLGHCSNPACVMFFSNSLADTDRKGSGFCPECRRGLERNGILHPIPQSAQ